MKKCIRDVISKVRGNNFDVEYSEIKSITDREGLLKFQEKYLTKLLLHAYKNVPYYHRIFEEVGVVRGDVVDLSKFDKIPILTKEIMRKHHKELISKDYTTRKWYYNSSGGSTGEPTRFIQDDLYAKWGRAAFYYWHKDIIGVDEASAKKVILWGSERDLFQGGMGWKTKIANWLTNTVFLNSFRMTEEDMENYIKTINSCKPDLIRGYAGSLYELCRYAERKNKAIHTPKIVVSSAETLSDEMREKIETIFGTKVYDYYGSRETNNLAGECERGLMHILAFHNYIEVLNNHNQPVKEGEEGRVIVTNLHNYSMLFIRYEIGDMAVLGPEKCKCGNVLPTLKKITGRITDHFVKEDGTVIHGEYFTHLFYLKDWVKAFQVIQEDYKRLKILAVTKDETNESEKKDIEDKIKLVMGKDCKIIWDFVDEIPRTESGKYLYTKSLIGILE
ncbi:MAG: phenylacetate--CoA ligase family protein [Nitrospiraceae bacterium]|nr:phenylacetate--CoA ligase family protein [Nitrospiraceae bacterium]